MSGSDHDHAVEHQVRPARLDDRDRVWPLVRGFATSYVPERPSFDTAYAQLVGDRHALLLVAACTACTRGSVCGYLLAMSHPTLFANGSVAWVEELMVAPDARRAGVGRGLMAHAETWAASVGAVYLALATRRADAFYRSLGYEESATFYRKPLTG